MRICAEPRRIGIVFSRVEVEKWRTEANRYCFNRVEHVETCRTVANRYCFSRVEVEKCRTETNR